MLLAASRTGLGEFSPMCCRKATYLTYAVSVLAILGCARLCAAEIAISRTSDMSFGEIVSNTFGGTVSISTGGARTTAGIAVIASSSCSPAAFLVTGDSSTSYAIILPLSVSLTGVGLDMTLDAFVSDPSESGVLDGAGSQTVYVGATLHVRPNQQAGAYNGLVDVSVAYE